MPKCIYCTQEGADEFLRQMRDDGKPPFSRNALVTINQLIHNDSKHFIEHKRLMKKDARYKRDPKEWWKDSLIRLYMEMCTLCANASKDLLKEAVTEIELRIILNHLVSVVKLSISRDNRGVKITDDLLPYPMDLLVISFVSNGSIDIIRDFLKSLASAVKNAKKAPPPDSGVGYALCRAMVQFFMNFDLHEDYNDIDALSIIEKSNILEQVLRHIHLPWVIYNDHSHKDIQNEQILIFFGQLGTRTISSRKIFKEGSSNREALLDILEGRLQPCKENEFVMEHLVSLKKFCDMSSLDSIETVVSKVKTFCTKCGKGNIKKELLVCSNCKFAAYCSHECQKADWKEHKGICRLYQTVKFKNLNEVFENFLAEHRFLAAERLRNKCLETGLKSTEFVLDLDFTSISGQVPPALRNPPEFEILPASIFRNVEENKDPNHWFFRRYGSLASSSIMKTMKDAEIESVKTNQNVVLVLNKFAEYQWLSFCQFPKEIGYKGAYGYQYQRMMAIEKAMEDMEIREITKTMSSLQKQEFVREMEGWVGEVYDSVRDNPDVAKTLQKDGTPSPDLVENEGEDKYNASTDM